MRNLYRQLAVSPGKSGSCCLATLVFKTGSAPQVPGSSALFGREGLISGTLGGGMMEAAAAEAATRLIRNGGSEFFVYDLNHDISDSGSGPVCGGKAGILIEASPEKHLSTFQKLNHAIRQRIAGVLMTSFRTDENGRLTIDRRWHAENESSSPDGFTSCLEEKKIRYAGSAMDEQSGEVREGIILEPVFPLPRLVIVGAGHIGRALAHLGSLLDFEVTVADDRPALVTRDNIPDADEFLTGDLRNTYSRLKISEDTYIVIATRDHHNDAEALEAFIGKPAAYIGMIGSRRKISLMRKKFLDEGLTTEEQWNRIKAPVGLDIGSQTVQEIALSIAAQLVQVRNGYGTDTPGSKVWGIVLAAGESKRMGTPKMLLSYGENTMIETVIDRILQSRVKNLTLILGAGKEAIEEKISGRPVHICLNPDYRKGMFTSVLRGFETVPPDTGAIMVFLGDQPMILPELIDRIIGAWQASDKGIVVPVYHKKRGHPVLIDSRYRDAVPELDPEKGLRSLMAQFPEDVLELDTEYSAVMRDIDTATDYQREIMQE